MDYKWIGLEQKWIGSRKLDFLSTPTKNEQGNHPLIFASHSSWI